MDDWHGFGADLNISQVYETTIADGTSGLSAHFVVVPARSLGGRSYLFQGDEDPLEALGLLNLADVPLGGVVRSLAACLASADTNEFLSRFHGGFEGEIEQPSTQTPAHFAFAEYLTFARAIPFEWTAFAADSLGSILTAQGYGRAAYASDEATKTPMLVVAIPAGILLGGSTPKVTAALDAGLRERLLALLQSLPKEERARGEEK